MGFFWGGGGYLVWFWLFFVCFLFSFERLIELYAIHLSFLHYLKIIWFVDASQLLLNQTENF